MDQARVQSASSGAPICRSGGFGAALSDREQFAAEAPPPTNLEQALARFQDLERELKETRSAMTLSSELLRNSNAEIDHSLKELERLNGELVEMNQLKAEFVANISHELRTPLNSVIGSLQMIIDGLCEGQQERDHYVTVALDSARSLLSIINDVLDVSKVDAGKLSLDVKEVEVGELFENLYESYGPAAQRAGLELKFEIADPEHDRVRGDRDRVRQVLAHLIGNAVKFTEEGGVKVTLAPYPGELATLLFSIEDSGIGIPQDVHDKVFEMFFQVDGSSRRKYEGTGVGLTISKRLIEFMGGQIWIVKSGRDRGTTISFTLPAGGRHAQPPQAAAPAADEAADLLLESF